MFVTVSEGFSYVHISSACSTETENYETIQCVQKKKKKMFL